MQQYINKHSLLPVLYTLSLSTCVHNMHVSPPIIYITMEWIMRYMFSLRLFRQMGAHTHVRQASPTFIYSFKPSLAVKLFSHDQMLINPKSNGLVYDVCVKNICVCCMVFTNALIYKYNLPLYQLFFPKSFNPIYPKTRFCFGRLEYTLLKFIIIIIIFIINAWHSLLYLIYVNSCSPMKKKKEFHNPHAISMPFDTYE